MHDNTQTMDAFRLKTDLDTKNISMDDLKDKPKETLIEIIRLYYEEIHNEKYKLTETGKRYLGQYIRVTDGLIREIERHAKIHGIANPDICAWYRDKDDFLSHWGQLGYTPDEMQKRILYDNEFMILPDRSGIIRFVT